MARYKLPYKRIRDVRFQPWVGKNYKQRSPRLLVVGMSHYSWEGKEVPDYFVTNEVIQGRLSGEWRSPFFTNIVATCIGKLPNDEDREQFWHSVAFYNYIQEFVGNAPRQKHSYVLWEKAKPAFAAVLRRLRPDLVLVIGRMNWDNISNLNGSAGQSPRHAPERRYGEAWRYPVGDGRTALAFHIKHTSAGYNFRKFAPLFHSAEKMVLHSRRQRASGMATIRRRI